MARTPGTPPQKSRAPLTIGVLFALALAGGGYWALNRADKTPNTATQNKGSARAPVHVATAKRQDFPVALSGLGTVQAYNSVTVRSRVDGQIMSISHEEGQPVKEGEVLIQIDPAPYQAALSQARAKLAQDEATLKSASQDLARTQALSKNGYATQQLQDQQTGTVNTLTAQLKADNAAIEAAAVQLAYTTIKSPIAGVTGFRLVDVGNIVHAADQTGIMIVNQMQPIAVMFTAPENQLPQIKTALEAGPVPAWAYSSDGATELAQGTLKLIDNQIDQASGTIHLKASFANDKGKLWPGLSVTTRLQVGTLRDVLVVPDSAVQRGPDGLYAYVVGADDKAQLKKLKVGRIADGRAVIEDGLADGDRVVTSGHYRVQDGGALAILADGAPGQSQKQASAD